ncbi:MAG: hypothetical protein ISS48_02755 [Candidatus Aenigmarchaeota archaeon]|nr:hypothetical protein [Candidatus Aenigmarchaeota archaeon]
MAHKSRFFYYDVWAKDQTKSKVNFLDILKNYDILKEKITIKRETERNYNLEIKKGKNSGFYYGVIVRTKKDSAFLHRNKDGLLHNLAKLLFDKEGETGEIRKDIVHFAFVHQDGQLIVLMEQGFQYPGIGVFCDYFKELTKKDNFKIEHKSRVKQKELEPLKKVFNKQLKLVKISFKKEVELSDELPIKSFLKKMLPKEYSLSLQIKLEKTKEPIYLKMSDFVRNFFGISQKNDNETIEAMLKMNLPEIFSVFDVEVFDKDVNISTSEKILDHFEKEEITVQREDATEFDRLGESLCEHLDNNIRENK